MVSQLLLPVGLRDDAVFGNFHLQQANAVVLQRLHAFLESGGGAFLLCGVRASGKSHLLQAASQLLRERELGVAYVPLRDMRSYPPAELLLGLETQRLVCLDDIDAIAGHDAWEEALFHLFNRCIESGALLLGSARKSPLRAGYRLADLQSRLAAVPAALLAELDDVGKHGALLERARHRGMAMELEIATFIMQRSNRDMQTLIEVLDRLDAATLEAKRRLSIPFVKSVLGW